MKKIIILIITILLITGCTKKVSDSELYGTWIGSTISNNQSLNTFIVTKRDYSITLYDNNTYHEIVTVTTNNIENSTDNTYKYVIDGNYKVLIDRGLELIPVTYESTNSEVKDLPNDLAKQLLYFSNQNDTFVLCIEANCNKVLKKNA